jgi:ABC-type branched-subunit amino acid transport system ATPase component
VVHLSVAGPARRRTGSEAGLSEPAAFEVENVHKRFGGLIALGGVTFSGEPGSVIAVIGPNGAGKTTLMDVISGFTTPDAGDVRIGGKSIRSQGAASRIKSGLGRTFQHPKVFAEETVFRNVLIGTFNWNRSPLISWITSRGRPSAYDEVDQVLELVGLEARADDWASALPYGLQKELDVARAIAARPRILLMDEPLAGLNHDESQRMLSLIQRLAGQGLLILLVEHHLGAIAKVANKVVVLHHGKQVAVGPVAEVYRLDEVRRVYTGRSKGGDA